MDPASARTLRSSAKEACGLLSVLAHEDRLVLLCHIAHDEHSVGELEELLDIHQPSLSQQLGVLRREGLVQTRREGKKIYYRLKSKEALAIIDSLYVQFCGNKPAARRPPKPVAHPSPVKRDSARKKPGSAGLRA
jgi:DNA-binding transcriptional ArsR family regulator